MILGRLVWRLSVDVSFFVLTNKVCRGGDLDTHLTVRETNALTDCATAARGACRKGNNIEAVSMRAQESRPVCPNSDGFIRSKYSRDGRKTTNRKNQ